MASEGWGLSQTPGPSVPKPAQLRSGAGTIVAAGHPGLIDTVLLAGRAVKRDGVLVGVDLPALRTRLIESRNRIAAAAGIPLGGTWHPRSASD